MTKFDNLSEDQIQALDELGAVLATSGWKPQKVEFEQFGVRDHLTATVRLAITFLAERREEIQARLCKDRSVKAEVQAAGATVGAIADKLGDMNGIEIPIGTLANVLCMLGIGKFCEWTP